MLNGTVYLYKIWEQ